MNIQYRLMMENIFKTTMIIKKINRLKLIFNILITLKTHVI